MEDKYFNEFFDKLYNGKLNIYEDEEEGGEEEKEEGGEDNEQNYIIPKNPNYSEDELEKIIGELSSGKQSSKSLIPYIKFILNNDFNKLVNDFKRTHLNGFWELYGIGKTNTIDQPAWRKYIRKENPQYNERLILFKVSFDRV